LLPQRLLEHAAAGAIAGIGLQVHLDGEYSYVDVSDDIKALAHGQLERVYFSLPDEVHDINLESLMVRVPARERMATLQIDLAFEVDGVAVQTLVGDLYLTVAALTLELALGMSGPVGERRFSVFPDLSVNLQGVISGLAGYVVDTGDVAGWIRDAAQEQINRPVFISAVGTYIEEVLLGLAQRGEVLYDVLPSAHPDFPGIWVYHHTAETPAYPRPPALPRPLPRPAPSALDERELANLSKFDHLVFLMQENRSFDHMLGWLRMRGRLDVDGLGGNESNTAEGLGRIPVHRLPRTTFRPSPDHGTDAVLEQIDDGNMDGFVRSFVTARPLEDPRLIMGFYPPELLHTFEFLTSNFLVCDRWFCSFPGETQPNRFCALGGYTPTMDNLSVDDPALGYLDQRTIFDELDTTGVDWVYYEHDVSFLRMFDAHRLDATRIVPIDDEVDGLRARLRAGTLPPVTFIDPDFVDSPAGLRATDDHPPADVADGQEMIRRIYNELFSSALASRILFVITYDEHGGFFDHVPPPGTVVANRPVRLGQATASRVNTAVPTGPSGQGLPGGFRTRAVRRPFGLPGTGAAIGWSPPPVHPDGPAFYGPRVPALVMSAYVDPETTSHVLFDHTSVLRTIALKWLGGDTLHLGPRLVQANHLGALLTRGTPRLNLPSITQQSLLFAAHRPPRRVRAEELDNFHEALGRFGKPPKPRPQSRPSSRPAHPAGANTAVSPAVARPAEPPGPETTVEDPPEME
jgi:phospholipase C